MIGPDNFLFTPVFTSQNLPQWRVTMGETEIGDVLDRSSVVSAVFPSYRVTVTGFEPTYVASRKEVMDYLILVANKWCANIVNGAK